MLLDASALLALLNDEPGAAEVLEVAGDAKMSAVNLAEVIGKLGDYGMPAAQIQRVIAIGFETLSFTEEINAHIPRVRRATRVHGLSLGDRCCLATALAVGEPVLTANRAWAKVKIRGLRIHVLRERA